MAFEEELAGFDPPVGAVASEWGGEVHGLRHFIDRESLGEVHLHGFLVAVGFQNHGVLALGLVEIGEAALGDHGRLEDQQVSTHRPSVGGRREIDVQEETSSIPLAGFDFGYRGARSTPGDPTLDDPAVVPARQLSVKAPIPAGGASLELLSNPTTDRAIMRQAHGDVAFEEVGPGRGSRCAQQFTPARRDQQRQAVLLVGGEVA